MFVNVDASEIVFITIPCMDYEFSPAMLLSFNKKFLVAHLRMVFTLAYTVMDKFLYSFKNLRNMWSVCFVKTNGRKFKVNGKEVAWYEIEFTIIIA